MFNQVKKLVMHILRFNVYRPSSLDEALSILSKEGKDVVPMAGGTELLVLIRDGWVRPKKVLDLWPVKKELTYVKREDGYIKIGAMTTAAELCSSEIMNDKRFLGFKDICKVFASPFLRNLATVGGNVGCSHPMSDLSIMLLAYDAEVKLRSAGGERYVPLTKFFSGLRKNVRNPEELIVEIRFPEPPQNSSSAFLKFDRRWSHAMGYVIVGAYMALEGNKIADVRLAFDSTGDPYPARAFKTEEFLRGKEFSEEVIREAYNNVLPNEMKRIDDYRASAEYRLDLSKVLMKRVLLKIKERIEGGV